MIPIGLFSQIATALLSVAIIFTYIKPTFADIARVQDSITIYQEEHAKVSQVNADLDELVSRIEAIPADDQRKLLTYMPDRVDSVAVVRDLNFIAETAGVLILGISYDGQDASESTAQYQSDGVTPIYLNLPEPHQFSLDFEGSYAQMKSVIKALEENDYPLEIRELGVTLADGGFLTVTMKITSYERRIPAPPATDPLLIQ